jgi:hypothetical protein
VTNSATRHAVLGGWLECAFSQDAPTNFKITNQGPAPHLVLVFLFVETLMPKGLQRQSHLISPSGLRADDAAAYLGMGKTKFLEWLIRAQYREHSQSTISRFGTGSISTR